ncbi:hypothetical protein PF003_g6801 [Phytophthora fragariae]|nr:hypothetical protein PF003_g6801 [Phytophthora fragariae]
MKARSNAKVMRRKQERLWEQRRLKQLQPRLLEAQREKDEQSQVLTQENDRVICWWKFDGVDDGTQQVSTPSSTNCNRGVQDRVRQERSILQGEDGCRRRSSTSCSTPAESWKTLRKEKACNRMERTSRNSVHLEEDRGENKRCFVFKERDLCGERSLQERG